MERTHDLHRRLRLLVGRSTRAICDSHLLLAEALAALTTEQRAYVFGLRGSNQPR
jgi:hypothetical protein